MECALLNYEAKIRFRCVERGRQQGYFANGSFSRVRKLSFDTKEGGAGNFGGQIPPEMGLLVVELG